MFCMKQSIISKWSFQKSLFGNSKIGLQIGILFFVARECFLCRDFQCLNILLTSQNNNNGKQCKYNVFLHEICLCQFFFCCKCFLFFNLWICWSHMHRKFLLNVFHRTYDYVCVRNMYCTTYALHNHSADYDLEKQSCHSSIAHVQ